MASPYPTVPRVFAGILTLAIAFFFGLNAPAGLLTSGYPITAYVMLGTTIPIVAFLGLLAVAPEALDKGMRRWTKADLHDAGHVAAVIVIACAVYFVLGYGALTNGVYAYEHTIVRGEESAPIDGNALMTGIILNLIILVLPPLFYVSFVGGAPWPGRAASEPAATDPAWEPTPAAPASGLRGALERLGLHGRDAGRNLLIGGGAAIGVLILIAILSYAVQGLQIEIPENTQALEIARSVTVLGAFGIAIGAAISEEVFFRGFLQPRVGLWGQAVLFSIAHLSYLNVLEFVVVFVLALIFGLLYKRTGSLLAPIAGHFLFNLLMLLAGIYAPDAA